MKKKMSVIDLIISLFASVAMVFSLCFVWYETYDMTEEKIMPKTLEEHIRELSKRIDERFMSENSRYGGYTDYEIFPLYNQNDELTHFLVEFEPFCYLYILINNYKRVPALYACDSHITFEYYYVGDDGVRYKIFQSYWSRWVFVGETYENGKVERHYKYETDENGYDLQFKRSHFKVAGIEGEKRYLLKVNRKDEYNEDVHINYIPAVKRGDKWLNLTSMEEFELREDSYPSFTQPWTYINFRYGFGYEFYWL